MDCMTRQTVTSRQESHVGSNPGRRQTMGCSCPDTSYQAVNDDNTKYELGPAYSAYQHGDSRIRSVWKQQKALIPDWVNDCCANLEGDWTYDPKWEQHTIMLVCFYVVAIALLGTFVALRQKQPFRFRDVRIMVIFWIIIVVQMTLRVITYNMSGTAVYVIDILTSFVGPPLVLAFYITKGLQVGFVYAWQQLKRRNDEYAKLNKFHKFKFVLSFEFFLSFLGATVIIASIPALFAIFGRDTFSDAPGPDMYATIRCEWWQIPEEFTIPKTNSTLCPCIRYGAGFPGTSADSCEYALQVICGEDEGVPEDSGFCEACATGMSQHEITHDCKEFLWDFYAAGNCGQPSEMPHTSSCAYGIIADRVMGYICAGICYFYLATNLVVVACLLGKRDEFWVIHEMMLCCLFMTGSLLFMFTGLFPNYGGMLDWYFDGLKINYRASYLFDWIFLWSVMLITFGSPLVVYAVRQLLYKSKRPVQPPAPPKSSHHHRTNSHLSVHRSSDRPSDTDRGSQLSYSVEDVEYEVQACLISNILREIYLKYAVEAFHVENVYFIADCRKLLDKFASDDCSPDQLLEEAQGVNNQYLARNAPMEVNIPSRIKDQVLIQLMQMANALGTNDENLMFDATLDLNKALTNAYEEILTLLSRDAWPRFRVSAHYAEYQSLINEEKKLSAVVMDMVSEVDDIVDEGVNEEGSSDDETDDDNDGNHRRLFKPPSALVLKILQSEDCVEDDDL